MMTLTDIILEKEKSLNNPLNREDIGHHLFEIQNRALECIWIMESKKFHNPYRHGIQIVNYARHTAKELSISENEIELISLAACLHDIGKEKIDKEIINKPGKLTDFEYEHIKKHCDYGAQIVMPLSYISRLIYFHHENWDGSGYLEGISGEKIPLGSRIIRVIDSFNAITHERPYKPSFSKEYAVDELKKGNGIQYDPKVVDAFLKILNKS
jgi:HD-GYP domain-containing protein (c-di-GMP phosphodiesterase class II)